MPPTHRITDAELEVLQALWNAGPARVRDLQAELPEAGWAYTTIQTLLHRLEDKGMVERDRSQGVTRYAATITRERLLHRRLDDLSKELGDGSVLSLMHGIAAGRRLDREEIAELRGFLDELESGSRGQKPGKGTDKRRRRS